MIPTFGLYSNEVDDGNENERMTTVAYKTLTSPNNANMSNNLLCKISNEDNSKLRFIPYSIQSLSKEGTIKTLFFNTICFYKIWKSYQSLISIEVRKKGKVNCSNLHYIF